MGSIKKRFLLSNIKSKKLRFFGGSSDLEPILYKNYELQLRKEKNLFYNLNSSLTELEDLLGQVSYLNKELKNIIKK